MHNAQQKLDATMQQVQAREREGATQE